MPLFFQLLLVCGAACALLALLPFVLKSLRPNLYDYFMVEDARSYDGRLVMVCRPRAERSALPRRKLLKVAHAAGYEPLRDYDDHGRFFLAKIPEAPDGK
ncbi:MAG TPA: hypothetical protein VFQ72_00700 [Candidatus Paceibacterota bacterium]|nr:hypothetical protein [Candidatus Paceibacterota bacterium]